MTRPHPIAGTEPLTPAWLVERVDGLVRTRTRGAPMIVTEVQGLIAHDLLDALEEIRHDGSWRLVWCEPGRIQTSYGLVLTNVPHTLECQWLDKDGDVQLVVEIEEQVDTIIARGLDHWCEQCEQAWKEWAGWMEDVDVQPHQTIKAAQGQQSVNPAIEAPDVVL